MKKFLATVFYCLKLSWRASKYYTVVRLAGKILLPVSTILTSFLLKYILDLISGAFIPDNKVAVLVLLVAGTAALALISQTAQKLTSYAEGLHNDILDKQISLSLMEKALSADLELFDNPKHYDKLNSVQRDSSATTFILWNALDFLSAGISFLGAFTVLCSSSPLYGLLMVAAAFPSAIAGQKYTKILYCLGLAQMNEERQKSYLNAIATNQAYAQDIRLFNLGGMLKKRYSRIWNQVYQAKKKKIKKRAIWTTVLEFLPEGVIVFVTLDISLKALSGASSVGDYSLYTGLLSQLLASILTLTATAMQIYENMLKIDNVKSFDEIPHRVADTGEIALKNVGTVEFRDVSFSYPGTERRVLSHVDFTVGEKERVALVGVNGAGKSTLIKLLLRFYDVSSGQILINGINIKAYTLDSLRRSFSCYFQNTPNYGFTLRENILIADQGREEREEELRKAILESDGADLLKKLPQGLDTYLTRMFDEHGAELSGGQNQKIALARTFYRNCSALILDEPSSNLDPEAEHRLFEALERLCEGKTTLFTSHRLSNIALADRIVVLENGGVVEAGTREELLGTPGRFSQLYAYQAEKFQGTRAEE